MSTTIPTGTWVSVDSHRARQRFTQIAGKMPSYGVWPTDRDGRTIGWGRGEFYCVESEVAERLRDIKGLRVMKSPPKGVIFKRI